MAKKKPTERKIWIDPNPKGERKSIGGADHDQWNEWLARTTGSALPVKLPSWSEAIRLLVRTEAAEAAISRAARLS